MSEAREKFERELSARTAPSPTRLAGLLDRQYKIREHLLVIGDAFTQLHEGKVDRVIITAPPQCGKSESAARWGPFWWLTKNPSHKVALVSYGDSLAVKHSRAIRRMILTYGDLFGMSLRPGSRSAHDWELETGGAMRAVGVESGLTGHPGDIVIVDDPLKDRADAESPRMRELVWDCYSGTIIPRLAPDAPVIIIATRWHPDDLIGRVVAAEGTVAEGGRWHMVHLPAFATHPDDVLGRALGEPLPHPKVAVGDVERLRRHWADKRKTVTPRDWAALYQGDPRPAEGALVSAEVLAERRHLRDAPEPTRVVVSVDPSGGGRDTAGIIGGYLGTDNKVYLVADRTGRMSSEQWSRRAVELAHELGAEKIIYERNYGGDIAKMVLRTAWTTCSAEAVERGEPDWGLCPFIEGVYSRRGKVLRAEPIAQQIVEDRVRFAAYLPELEHEWATWVPGPVSPGRIDAAVHLCYGLLPQIGVPTAQILNPNDYALASGDGGQSIFTQLRIVR